MSAPSNKPVAETNKTVSKAEKIKALAKQFPDLKQVHSIDEFSAWLIKHQGNPAIKEARINESWFDYLPLITEADYAKQPVVEEENEQKKNPKQQENYHLSRKNNEYLYADSLQNDASYKNTLKKLVEKKRQENPTNPIPQDTYIKDENGKDQLNPALLLTNPDINEEAEKEFREKYKGQAQVYDAMEKIKIYEDHNEDPTVKKINKQIKNDYFASLNGNSDPSGLTPEQKKALYWKDFAQNHTEKAKAYADKHDGIKSALEQVENEKSAQKKIRFSFGRFTQRPKQPPLAKEQSRQKKKDQPANTLNALTDPYSFAKQRIQDRLLGYARKYAARAGRFIGRQGLKIARAGMQLAAKALSSLGNLAANFMRSAASQLAASGTRAAAMATGSLAASTAPVWIPIVIAIALIILVIVLLLMILMGSNPFHFEGDTTITPTITQKNQIPGLSINLIGPIKIDNNQDISYTATITYSGGLDVTIYDPLPVDADFVSATGIYTKGPNPVTGTSSIAWKLNENKQPVSSQAAPGTTTQTYTFTIVLRPGTSDVRVTNKIIAYTPASAGGEINGTCPAQQQIDENKKDRNACRFLNPAINIFDTTISQQTLDTYIVKYSPVFIRAGIGTKEDFTNRVNYIVSQAQKAGLNPVIFLGYWKTESAFSTVGSRDLGCAGANFYEQVDCATGLSAGGYRGAQCATSRDASSKGCKDLKGIRNSHPNIYGPYPLEYPIATFDDFAEGYGSIAPNLEASGINNNCIHTYNALIEVGLELNACATSTAATALTSEEKPIAPFASQDPQQLRQDILNKFSITMDGFDIEHLQWAWGKLWDVSQTNFPMLTSGVRMTASTGQTSYADRLCAGGIRLAQAGTKEVFQFILTHELAHSINFCHTDKASLDEQIAAYNQEEGVSYYARNANKCNSAAMGIEEDYADMIAYYLNPNMGVGGCTASSSGKNPYANNGKRLHYNTARKILGNY